MIELRPFFDSVRSSLFGGGMNSDQVKGIEEIIDYWVDNHPNSPPEFLDYLLATTFHETAFTMQPIKEYGGPAYFHRMYDINGDRPHVAQTLGNIHPGDGARFCGRGYVMITGRKNYIEQGRKQGADFVSYPDRVMMSRYALPILFEGCIDGDFTGKKLGDYIRHGSADFVNARRVVNGTDKAQTIANYAKKFGAARKAATIKQPGPVVGGKPFPKTKRTFCDLFRS